MSSSQSKNWIVVDAKKNGALVCKRCGTTITPEYPIGLEQYGKLLKDFGKNHSKCKEPKNGNETKA